MSVSVNGTNGLTFNDGSSQNTSAYGGGFAMRNRIINGAMVIDQRNAGAVMNGSNLTSAPYSVDRWQIYGNVNSKFTTQQTPSATETGFATRVAAGFQSYLAITSSSSYSVAAGDSFFVGQQIEANNISDLAWGTASAKTITLSFLVYSSLTGTFGGAILNGAGTYSYPFTYSISSANTWTSISITIAGPTAGTWVTTGNSSGMQVLFGLGVGTTRSGTANAWAAATYYSATGATSVVGTNGATFYITGVQLEKGSTATSFDYRPYGTELALCQRYYVKTFPQATAPAQNAGNTGALEVVGQATNTLFTVNWMLPVEMRDTPSTVTTFSTNAASANWSTNTQTPTASLGSTGSKLIAVRAGTSLAAGSAYFINVTASAEL